MVPNVDSINVDELESKSGPSGSSKVHLKSQIAKKRAAELQSDKDVEAMQRRKREKRKKKRKRLRKDLDS